MRDIQKKKNRKSVLANREQLNSKEKRKKSVMIKGVLTHHEKRLSTGAERKRKQDENGEGGGTSCGRWWYCFCRVFLFSVLVCGGTSRRPRLP